MRRFSLVWSSQLFSAIGSGTAWFAVSLWVWGESGSATMFALLTLLALAPGLALAPLAGVVVDRIGPRLAVLIGDGVLAVLTCLVLTLYLTDNLQIWHLLVIAVVEGVMESLHWVAYMALVPVLVAEEKLVRANGMIDLASPGAEIMAPALGGVLLALADLSLILTLDLVTFAFAATVLLMVRTPRPAPVEDGTQRRSWAALRADLLFGFSYIFRSRPLVILLCLFFVLNFSAAVSYALTTPLVMLRSGDDHVVLGTVLAVGGVGGVLGALFVSAFGHRFRRMTLVLAGMAVGVAGGPLLMGLAWTPWLWIVSSLVAGVALPAVNSAYQAIWQSRVPQDQQGRVFGARRLLAQSSLPLGMLIAGPMVDYVLTPLFADTDGIMVTVLGGDKTGATSFLLVLAGLMGLVAVLGATTSTRLRGFGEPVAAPPTEREETNR